jgi:hypothetical protein
VPGRPGGSAAEGCGGPRWPSSSIVAGSSVGSRHWEAGRGARNRAPSDRRPLPAANAICYSGAAQVPKSKSLTTKLFGCAVTWNVRLTLSTVPPPLLTIWSFWVEVNCSPPVLALMVPPNQTAPLIEYWLPGADGPRGDCVHSGVALERIAGDVLGEVHGGLVGQRGSRKRQKQPHAR